MNRKYADPDPELLDARFTVRVIPELDERGKPKPGSTRRAFGNFAEAAAFFRSVSPEVEMRVLLKVKGGRETEQVAQVTRGEVIFDTPVRGRSAFDA